MSSIHDLAAPYVLGSLGPEEESAFETHLDECDLCRREVSNLGQGLTAMAFAGAEEPPSEVRQRVFDAIGPLSQGQRSAAEVTRRRPRRFVSAILIPAAAVVALILAFAGFLGAGPVDEIAAADDAVSIDLTATESYPGDAPAIARVVYSASQGIAAVDFDGLIAPGEKSTYQLWLIGEGDPLPAGIFSPDEDGVAQIRIDGRPVPGQMLGITEEPEGGSPAPTGEVLFAAEI